jgi:uncharacterized protein YcaQ
MAELFEFDYQLEMYKPAAKRRWGYFALPILVGDRLVGKLDATADRKAGQLRVTAIHQDMPFDAGMTAAVHDEIEDLAHWLELDLTLLGGGSPRQSVGTAAVGPPHAGLGRQLHPEITRLSHD